MKYIFITILGLLTISIPFCYFSDIKDRKKFENSINLLKYAMQCGTDKLATRIVLGNFHNLDYIRKPDFFDKRLIRFCNTILRKNNINYQIKIKEI